MKGYRNLLLALATLACLTWVALAGIKAGSDLIGLGTVLGAIAAAGVGSGFARGYNKKCEAANGGIQ